MSTSELSYDEIPYPDLCHPYTHPGRIAAIAGLVDIAPAPPEHCRVLEIGCAGGGNLVPMAYGLPGSTFVGIDLSPRQIGAAGELARRVGVGNVELRAMDVMDMTDELGTFDYIITHGVYSWVPDPVKDQLLSICRHHLAPAGIAYVSYNTLPGWHSMLMLREMMLHHTRHITDPHARAVAARALITWLRSILPDVSALPFAALLDAYTEGRFARFGGNTAWDDSALLHDELGAINDPLYFHEFVDHAHRHRLRYLTEATFPRLTAPGLSSTALTALNELGLDPIEREQHLDYVVQRSFRRSLLCHDEVELRPSARPGLLGDLYVTASRPPAAATDAAGGATSARVRDPITVAALDHLGDVSPRAVHFTELLTVACRRAGIAPPDGAAAARLSGGLLEAAAFGDRDVTLLAHDPVLTPEPSERPLASPVTRIQARRAPVVANLCHEMIVLDGIGQTIVPLLDGRRTRADLLVALVAILRRTGRGDAAGAEPLSEPSVADLAAEIERSLQRLARAGVLCE